MLAVLWAFLHEKLAALIHEYVTKGKIQLIQDLEQECLMHYRVE